MSSHNFIFFSGSSALYRISNFNICWAPFLISKPWELNSTKSFSSVRSRSRFIPNLIRDPRVQEWRVESSRKWDSFRITKSKDVFYGSRMCWLQWNIRFIVCVKRKKWKVVIKILSTTYLTSTFPSCPPFVMCLS